MFVLVWEYINSTESLSDVAKKLLRLFNIEDKDEVRSIETQKSYKEFREDEHKPKDQKDAIPDISITLKNRKIIIVEVKIDQDLNIYYNSKDKEFDQIDFYQNIKDVEKVYLLSRDVIKKKDFLNNYRWRDIYSILKERESDFIIKNFLGYLDEKGMGNPTPFNMHDNNLLKVIGGFDSLLHDAWEKCSFKKYFLSTKTYAQCDGFGFYIREIGNDCWGTTRYFLGVNPEYEDEISFWFDDVTNSFQEDEKLEEFDRDKNIQYITRHNINIKLSDLNDMKRDEQLEVMVDWLIKNVKPYLDK